MDEFDKYPTDATKQGKDGVQSKGSLGSSVAYLGDINRDGYGDYVAGSALQDVNGLKDVGVAYVISGKTGAVVRTFTGISANDYFGHAVANAGDFDRDGVNDIIIGAYGTDVDYGNGTLVKDVGSISVFSGSTGALIYRKWGSQAKDYFGYSVAGGIEQPIYTPTPTGILFPTIITPSMWPSPTPGVILGGSPTPTPVCSGGGVIVSGGGFICSISTTTPTPAPAFRSYSSSIVIYDSTYNSLPYIGIAVGSPLADIDDGSGMLLKDAGKVEVFYGGGSTTYSQFSGDAAMGKFGSSVALAGDVNGDGRSDIVAGAPSSNSATGYVKVISLSNNLTLNTLSGGNVGDSFGFSVSAAGDVNNDGFNDVIVGAYKKDSSGKQDVGSAAIYSGNTSQVLYEFTGDVVKDLLGFSVASAGDINNDGFDDVVVSSYGYDVPATNTSATLKDAGKITVYSGANGNTLFSVNGEGKQDIFGSSVSAGDVNKDGVPDILVGAFKDDVQNNGASMKDAGSITIISGAAALP